jgi:hypothetical protein
MRRNQIRDVSKWKNKLKGRKMTEREMEKTEIAEQDSYESGTNKNKKMRFSNVRKGIESTKRISQEEREDT